MVSPGYRAKSTILKGAVTTEESSTVGAVAEGRLCDQRTF